MHEVMVDKHGRRMRKLRISLLDACNMRCVYCMPDNPHFLKREEWASAGDITRIATILCDMGIEEIRLTGGEPTMRPDFLDIVKGLAPLKIQKFGLTTNALLLEKYLDDLYAFGCHYLNISLDSLNKINFHRITKRDALDIIMPAILRARKMGFHVKVNAVIMRGLNDHEILDFVDWSGTHDIPLRFLEAMNIGVMQPEFRMRLVPASEMIDIIGKKYVLSRQNDAKDATAYTVKVDNGATLGFIASETEPFCGQCSRLRLTPQGHIRPCLFMNTGINLVPLLASEYPEALKKIIAMKPIGRIDHVEQPMYQIGG